jgi:predicted nucleotidyltransferase
MREEFLSELVEAISNWPEVVAIAEAGSQVRGNQDQASDLDLYIYVHSEVPFERRSMFIDPRSDDAELDNRIWETGDEWTDRSMGMVVDMMYRSPDWIERELARVLDSHEASLGYSTCLWENVRSSKVLFDRTGWYGRLKRKAARPYPAELARSIVEKNYPLLCETHSAFQKQILKAASRNDSVSVNHRTTAFLACYFDVLFALNRVPHPGEKRLLDLSGSLEFVPGTLRDDIHALMSAGSRNETTELRMILNRMITALDLCLRASALANVEPTERGFSQTVFSVEPEYRVEPSTEETICR